MQTKVCVVLSVTRIQLPPSGSYILVDHNSSMLIYRESVLWSGTPILTWPRRRYKMCSRVASSVAYATGYGDQMVVNSIEEYQDRAVYLANGLLQSSERSRADGESAMSDRCELTLLRRNIFLNRDHMPLFDTLRWTRNIEKGYQAAWARWVDGSLAENRESGSIFIRDDEPVMVRSFDEEF